FQAEDGIRDFHVTGVQTCALPIYGYRDCGTKAEAYQKEAGVACGRCGGISGYQKACDLDENRDDKHMWAVSMEVVGNGCNDEDRSEERRVGKERRARGWEGQGIEK